MGMCVWLVITVERRWFQIHSVQLIQEIHKDLNYSILNCRKCGCDSVIVSGVCLSACVFMQQKLPNVAQT